MSVCQNRLRLGLVVCFGKFRIARLSKDGKENNQSFPKSTSNDYLYHGRTSQFEMLKFLILHSGHPFVLAFTNVMTRRIFENILKTLQAIALVKTKNKRSDTQPAFRERPGSGPGRAQLQTRFIPPKEFRVGRVKDPTEVMVIDRPTTGPHKATLSERYMCQFQSFLAGKPENSEKITTLGP